MSQEALCPFKIGQITVAATLAADSDGMAESLLAMAKCGSNCPLALKLDGNNKEWACSIAYIATKGTGYGPKKVTNG